MPTPYPEEFRRDVIAVARGGVADLERRSFGRHNITLGPDALNPLLERLWPTAEAGQ